MRLALASAISLVIAFNAKADESVTIRATSGLPEAAIEYIARISEPRWAQVKRDELPEEFISQVCGSYTNAFGKVFFGELNKKLVREPKKISRDVKMPACAKWQQSKGEGVPVRVLPGDVLDTVLLRKIGRVGNQPLKCSPDEKQSSRCGQKFRDLVQKLNPGKNLDELVDGQIIFLPFTTYPVTFKVRPSANVTALEVINRIAELGNQDDPDGPIIRNIVAPPVRLVAAVAFDENNEQDQVCSNARQFAKRPWPYDAPLVASVIKRNISEIRESGQQSDSITVTVLDTGLDETFPSNFLRRDNSVAPKYAHGIGVYRKDNIRPFPNHDPREARLHGTAVAAIVAGGSGLRTVYPELNNLFRLNVVNIIHPSAVMGQYEINTGGLTDAMNWFIANGQIANLSVGSDAPLPGLRDAIYRNSHLLVVVAAGNESQPLSDHGLYPAIYGGLNEDVGKQFITVAAHDGSLVPATFSNWSNAYVDLLAPGCDIPYESGELGVHGTSFAAPLVSMTAALLRAFGLKHPRDVKRRLQASVDFDEYLKGLVLWSGRLNIAKALSLYHDVLEKRSTTELSFGQWQFSGEELCADRSFDFDTIRKISGLDTKNPVGIRILYADVQGRLTEHICEPLGSGLTFTDVTGTVGEIPWLDLLDLIPRHFHR